MDLRSLKNRIANLAAKHGPPDERPSGVIRFRIEDGQPIAEDVARNSGAAGVMLLPVFGSGTVEDWEKAAVESQRQLKASVRD